MQKLTLAEQVLQKIREKKDLEEKNRPHHEVMRLQAMFVKECNSHLKEEIGMLEQQLKQEEGILEQLEEYSQSLDSTGKRDFPRIIVRPDFLGSERINGKLKQFLVKLSNTFLRVEIIRKRNFDKGMATQKEYTELLGTLSRLQQAFWRKKEEKRAVVNQKRVRVLKEEIRLRQIQGQIKQLRDSIFSEREANIELLRQYQIKKVNGESRKIRLLQVQRLIASYKQKIEEKYNPVTYRQHLRKIFEVQFKNEKLIRNLEEIHSRMRTVEIETESCQKSLEKTSLFSKIGRLYTPSGKKKKRNQSMICSSGVFGQSPKMVPIKANISVIYTEDTLVRESKQLCRSKQLGDVNIFAGCSPRHSLKASHRSNFPKYRSAFSKRG